MQNELSEIIIESVHDVFLAFLAKEVFPGDVLESSSGADSEGQDEDVAVVVGFSGAVHGGIYLRCPLVVALQLSSSMAGESFSDLHGRASDSLGELTNMVANGVQNNLAGVGSVHLATPTVITGSQLGMDYQSTSSRFKQSFKVDEWPFSVECFLMSDSG